MSWLSSILEEVDR